MTSFIHFMLFFAPLLPDSLLLNGCLSTKTKTKTKKNILALCFSYRKGKIIFSSELSAGFRMLFGKR